MRSVFPLGILLAGTLSQPLSSQKRRPLLERMLLAEDHRAAAGPELRTLLAGLGASDTTVVRLAARALGRLERPALAARILPLLAHPAAGVRLDAAQAVAQAAQGFRGDSLRSGHLVWDAIFAALGGRVALEQDPTVRGTLALSLGRLPYLDPGEIRRAQGWLLALAEGSRGEALADAVRGMETLVRLTGRRVPLPEPLLARLMELAGAAHPDPRVRRSALGALLAAQRADVPLLEAVLRDSDPLLRRLALTAAARLPERRAAEGLLRSGLTDSSVLVRYEALRGWARVAGASACPALREAVGDGSTLLSLLALDQLGSACAGDSLAARALLGALSDTTGGWHRAAHALLSLARVAPAAAAARLPAAVSAGIWQRRMYAARTAGVLRDAVTLRRLASDSVANVREAALAALSETSGHAGDTLYRAALASGDFQLVLTAANALAGSPERDAALQALLRGLARVTALRRETSRDPRVALLVRLRELGGPRLAPRLLPWLQDFDPAVAESAAALLSSWTGRRHAASPRRLPPPAVSLGEIERLRGGSLRFTLASGGVFEVALLVDDAPLTVLRVVRLAARGYYDGLSFHRVVPNFVIQGGSPGANEYAGDGPFMRDELGPLSHERGTLGISTRGRDTGDAQLFVNLVDNPRLDFEYTVWGRVIAGMPVVDAVLEGDVIRRVEIRYWVR